MSYPKTSLLSAIKKITYLLLILSLLVSCKSWKFGLPPSLVRKYPKNKPFVYNTDIKLYGNLSKKEKGELSSKLRPQLEDSINPRFRQKLLWQVLKNPAPYDSAYVVRSMNYMQQMLVTSGYLRAHVDSFTYRIDTVKKKDNDYIMRMYLTIHVPTEQLFHYDSIWYSMKSIELQRLADSTKPDSIKVVRKDSATAGVTHPLQQLADTMRQDSYLKVGGAFSQDTIQMELNRLVELYRNNGYMKFTREGLIAIWDTLNPALLKPATDPFTQIQMLRELEKKRLNPTTSLEITLRPGYDSANMIKYHVGRITIYPDYGPDSTDLTTVVMDSTISVRYHKEIFKPRILPENVYMRRGDVYDQRKYFQTITRWNTLVAWRLVNMQANPRDGTDTVDFDLKLTPSKKYLAAFNIEGSSNDNNFTTGNLFGIGVNLTLQNRNFIRRANQENIIARFGTELGRDKNNNNTPYIESRQYSFGYSIVFPRNVLGRRTARRPNTLTLDQKTKGNIKSIVGLNYANTERHDLYRIKSLNTSFGFDATYKNWLIGWKIPNIEFSVLDTLVKLKQIFQDHPDLRNVFNAGLVVSTILSGTRNFFINTKDIISVKLNTEISPLPYFNHFMRDNYFRFIKVDGDLKWSHKNGNNVFVARLFSGIGLTDSIGAPGYVTARVNNLPFFKSYYAGGPNSMRGWGLRRLGPGHTTEFYDTLPDRFGDFQLELNLEKRFYLFKLFTLNFNGATFTDIGNVWFIRPNDAYPGGDLKSSNIIKDLAIDWGLGLRADLGFFLIRLDYAFKVRDPAPEKQNIDAQYKWFYDWQLFNGTLQFGVTYPF
jgi:hypothetical protein